MIGHEVRILSVTIDVPLAFAYGFAHRPENFMRWASGLARTLHRTAEGWVADTPAGEAQVRFSDANDFGVLDHWVTIAGKPEIYIPLRMVANGESTEAELMLLRQPEMSDADFENDIAHVRADLDTLKRVIESES